MTQSAPSGMTYQAPLEARRAGKRQSAPFSKGEPKDEPATPGRKRGDAHGRHGHRMAPADVDRSLDAPLPDQCPHCLLTEQLVK